MKRYSWLFFLLMLPLVVGAERSDPVGLIGLLELPYTWEESAGKNRLHQTYKLHEAVALESSGLGSIDSLDHIETFEWSYEIPAAAIYDYQHDGEYSWYRVKLTQSGRLAWIKGGTQTTFHPLSALVSESLPYMTAAWDGRIFTAAGYPETAITLSPRSPETPIAVAGSTMVEGELWVLIVVLKDSACSSSDPPRVLESGWVPAHATNGKLNIWFYSRGC